MEQFSKRQGIIIIVLSIFECIAGGIILLLALLGTAAIGPTGGAIFAIAVGVAFLVCGILGIAAGVSKAKTPILCYAVLCICAFLPFFVFTGLSIAGDKAMIDSVNAGNCFRSGYGQCTCYIKGDSISGNATFIGLSQSFPNPCNEVADKLTRVLVGLAIFFCFSALLLLGSGIYGSYLACCLKDDYLETSNIGSQELPIVSLESPAPTRET
ncbi:uncharacterized protein LOC135691745 isoform X2 [Rhopilema esculentum]|uniref:uncharacterized protein LOC135691745 isoform X1 n=1 Tax=Rhopilema esculentum TaxID=499914 RepID=UPI0031D2F5FC